MEAITLAVRGSVLPVKDKPCTESDWTHSHTDCMFLAHNSIHNGNANLH